MINTHNLVFKGTFNEEETTDYLDMLLTMKSSSPKKITWIAGIIVQTLSGIYLEYTCSSSIFITESHGMRLIQHDGCIVYFLGRRTGTFWGLFTSIRIILIYSLEDWLRMLWKELLLDRCLERSLPYNSNTWKMGTGKALLWNLIFY